MLLLPDCLCDYKVAENATSCAAVIASGTATAAATARASAATARASAAAAITRAKNYADNT